LASTGQISSGWRLKVDTSCGGEIVSPPLPTTTGFKEVAKVCSMIKKIAALAGKPAVDGECGLHIHFDASPITPKSLGNLFTLLHATEPVIYEMYPARNKTYCAPLDINIKMASRFRDWIEIRDQWYRPQNNVKDKTQLYSNEFINSDAAGSHYDGTRYHGFNIHCYWSIGTIEFRYAAGTVDIDEIIAYYEMCRSLISAAVTNKKITVGERLREYNAERASSVLRNKRGLGRKHIIDLHKFCKFTRNTMRFMLKALKKNKSVLLLKENQPIRINDGNCHEYLYSTGYDCYNYLGEKVISNPENKTVINCSMSPNGCLSSKDSRYRITISIKVKKPIKNIFAIGN